MKKFFASVAAIALAALVSCQKQQTEAEKNAELERQVQQRLAAERQTEQEKQLSQREADLQTREKKFAETDSATATRATIPDRTKSVAFNRRLHASIQKTRAMH